MTAVTSTPPGRYKADAGSTAPPWPALPNRFTKAPTPLSAANELARNHFTGIVTKVVKDKVMAQVELQAGPFGVVALISREAVDDMALLRPASLRRPW